MSRLLLFVFGLLVGAVGTWLLCWNGTLPVAPAPTAVTASANPALPATVAAPLPAANAPEMPAPPAPPGSIASPMSIIPAPPLSVPMPAAPASSDMAAPSTIANASESSVPTTADAAAAVIAANSSGALLIPVQGVQAAKLTDTFTQARGAGRLHDAIDIMAARGTPVFAAADGRVAKLFTSKPGGLTVYQFDRQEKLAYYYAHLDHYAPGLAEGQVLKRGQVLGFVGSTGNASPEAPHLHFAIFVLGPEKKWWQGTAVNPYPLLGGR